MKRHIAFPLAGEDGQVVTVEVEQPVEPGLERAARGNILERADETFETAVGKIKPAMAGIIASVKDLAQAPDDVTIVFGIKFDAKSGIVISSAGVEANLQVTLAWRKVRAPV
jgi:hypothetical protein